MQSLPKMSRREVIGTTIILMLFGVALGLMYWLKKMSLLEIAAIIAMGGVFVGGSMHLYTKMWDDED